MTKKIVSIILICLLLFPIYIFVSSRRIGVGTEGQEKAAEYFAGRTASAAPCMKSNGDKFTIAYVDIDPYPASGEMLYYFIQEMNDTGWITLPEELPFDPEDTDAKELINYLADRDLGNYIRFSRDANYYIAVDDKEECMQSLRRHVSYHDIDLIFCLGTSPAEMVIKEMGITEVPVMVYFSVDPVGAGLSETEEYSGQENVWCHTSSDVYANQLQFYYDSIPFENIGMIYYNESVAAMSQYRAAAEDMGVRITEKKIDTLSSSQSDEVTEYYNMLKRTFEELVNVDKVDAFMLNTDIIKDPARVSGLLDIFYKNGIPVYVQNGEYYVEYGAFMVVTASDAKVQAPFAVNAMATILNGENPGDVYEKFVPSPYLSINLEVAERLNYEVPEELLLSAENLYTTTRK